MKFIDLVLQQWRIAKVAPYVFAGANILDLGSADGALFQSLKKPAGSRSLGIDPLAKTSSVKGSRMIAGFFPDAMPADAGPFDIITMLAVLEHFPAPAYGPLGEGCRKFLRPGGKLLITVPSPAVDKILTVLKFFRLIDGMSLEEHHGFQVARTLEIFSPPQFRLLRRETFQLGLNNLFVLERAS